MSQELTFEEAVAALGQFQKRGWRLGIDRMQEFLHRLGLDHKLGQKSGSQFIHVAGTNGKGSVTAYLQSLLFEQGYLVGATYSPYVYDVRERVQLGLDLISKENFARCTSRLLPVAATMDDTEFGGPTEFEMKTALGFMYWAEKRVEWVALEVGLGGRLDATNVVDPACSVIVSIGLDHMEHLGNTLREIAFEKAGIIKTGKPVIVGQVPDEARNAILNVAQANGSEVVLYGRDVVWDDGRVTTPHRTYDGLVPGIKGHMQGHNVALAIAAMEASGAMRDPHLVRSVADTRLPGRFEKLECCGRTFILDGAHNPEAAHNLVTTLQEQGFDGTYRLITGRLEGHPSRAFYETLSPVVSRAYVTRIGFHRSLDPVVVIEEAGPALLSPTPFQSSIDALQACIDESQPGETILVTGSFYLVGEVGNAMKSGRCRR